MKVQKIKKVCLKDGIALVETPTRGGTTDCNHVVQWVGTHDALYAVDTLRVDIGILAAIWDLTDKQKGEVEWREDTEKAWLTRLPQLIDEDAPKLGVLAIGDYCFFQQDVEAETPLIVVTAGKLEPVKACHGRCQYMVMRDDQDDPWLICYVNGELKAAIRASNDPMINGVVGAVRVIAQSGVTILAKNE